MINCKPIATRLQPHHNLVKTIDHLLPTTTSYSSIVRALQYLTTTRPDLTRAVNLVCQFMHAPYAPHLQAVKHILRYIKGTVNHGIRILSNSSMSIYGFVMLTG